MLQLAEVQCVSARGACAQNTAQDVYIPVWHVRVGDEATGVFTQCGVRNSSGFALLD